MDGQAQSGPRARRFAAGSLVAVLAVLGTWCSVEPAGAAVTSFTISPSAGPVGTVVHVRGGGCAPGLLGSGAADYVAVTATTFDIAFRAPVAPDGRWSGSFTVPAGGGGVTSSSAPVTAVCVSSNLPSLTTVYTPKAFTVTAPPSTTRPPPATDDPSPRTVYVPADPATVGGGPTADERVVGATAGTTARSGANPTSSTAKRDAKRDAEPATLQPVGLDSRSSAGTGGAGLGWLGWTLLAVLLVAALGASGVLWHSRRTHDAMPGGAS